MIVNALNPKTALFFLAFLPQFIAPDRGGVWSQALVLGFVFVGLGLITEFALRTCGRDRRRPTETAGGTLSATAPASSSSHSAQRPRSPGGLRS